MENLQIGIQFLLAEESGDTAGCIYQILFWCVLFLPFVYLFSVLRKASARSNNALSLAEEQMEMLKEQLRLHEETNALLQRLIDQDK